MKLIPFYETSEVNGVVSGSKVFFKPKGHCKFYAVVEYRWKHLHLRVELETMNKITRPAFAKWSQEQLGKCEKEFYGHLVMTKLNYGITYSTEDVVGTFKSYVMV